MALLVAISMMGCPTAKKPEKEPSGLVKTTTPAMVPIDTAKASKDVAELMRAVRMAHGQLGAVLGPHKFTGTSTVEILRGDTSLDKIDENVVLELGAKRNYRGIRNLSGDHGKEVIFLDGTLYLRPRYSKFHRRAPESKGEPVKLRNQLFSTLAQYMDPLAHIVDLGAATDTQFAGRSAHKIELKTLATPRARTAEGFSQRKWRETIVGGSVSGHIILDKKTGAPLAANVTGEVQFTRKGERLRMKISLGHAVADLGKAVAIAAPPADQVVDTLQRSRETDERDRLLKGIAPPAGKSTIPSN